MIKFISARKRVRKPAATQVQRRAAVQLADHLLEFPPVNRTPLWLSFVFALLLLPLTARAGSDPNDTNPLLADQGTNPCFAIDDVVKQTVFGGGADPNDPNAPVPFEIVITDPNDPREVNLCDSLCKKGGASCMRFVKRAAACQTRWAADSATFKTRVHCNGLTGDLLKSCAAGFQAERTNTVSDPNTPDDPKSILNLQTAGLNACANAATSCQSKCNAP